MWERACSRIRFVIQHLCRLMYRFREQARSHRFWGCLGDGVRSLVESSVRRSLQRPAHAATRHRRDRHRSDGWQ
ncbi:hypothetical protein BSZ28_23350 [Pseudomonas moraviensis]|nr:hypothetical protein BSZ28_23350 [Pseudomonas moraviensis]